MPRDTPAKSATLHRKALPGGICGHGVRAKAFLEEQGFDVDDRLLTTQEALDAFKAEHGVTTTPQIFLDGARIGGLDDLQAHLGVTQDKTGTSYAPVIALFSVAAALAIAVTWLARGVPLTGMTLAWFIALSMVLLGLQKLQDLRGFATMFANYDLLAARWYGYGYVYPFIETGAGLLMLAGVAAWVSAPPALIAAGIGAVSVFKAVYVDKRSLNCACVGGDSRVPLGFVSLLENLMMVGMAIWMLVWM